jgi:hypothetical protein
MLADLIGEKGDRKIDKSQRILITKYTLRLDDDVYQMSNITGFGVGQIPKSNFPWKQFLISGVIGLATIMVGIGLIALAYAAFLVYRHFNNTSNYGLSIQLNSGKEVFLTTPNKAFLGEIVTSLYEFMDTQREGSMTIDMRNYSINVDGNFQGNLAQGGSTAQGDSANIGGPFNGNFVAGNSNHLN